MITTSTIDQYLLFSLKLNEEDVSNVYGLLPKHEFTFKFKELSMEQLTTTL
ncbi:MAG: hypothetical protein WCO54_02235 [Bacteroidota bacterium]